MNPTGDWTVSIMWASTDEALLSGLASGDRDAAAAFVGRFQRRVYGVAFAILGEPASAEDVAQETMARAWKHAGSYDPLRGSVTSWVLTIAKNLAIDARRARRLDVRVDVEAVLELDPSSEGEGPEEVALSSVDHARVRRAVAELPPEQRRALVLATIYGLSGREISEQDGLPLGTVKTRIRMALMKLRAALAERDDERSDV
jgi:RNA polymerase sigma-70 factor (ECF subfamily)